MREQTSSGFLASLDESEQHGIPPKRTAATMSECGDRGNKLLRPTLWKLENKCDNPPIGVQSKGLHIGLPNGVFQHLYNRWDVQVFSPFRDLAGGHRESRRRAEGCIGRGGIALCGYCLSLADVPMATASGGRRAAHDA